MIMPIDIDKKEFSRDKKGYNSREVDEFLDIIVADYEKVLNDNRSMAHKIKQRLRKTTTLWLRLSRQLRSLWQTSRQALREELSLS